MTQQQQQQTTVSSFLSTVPGETPIPPPRFLHLSTSHYNCLCAYCSFYILRQRLRQSTQGLMNKQICIFTHTQIYICACMRSCLSHVQLSATPWTAVHQALCAWDSPGKSTGVGCHCLLHQIALALTNGKAGCVHTSGLIRSWSSSARPKCKFSSHQEKY